MNLFRAVSENEFQDYHQHNCFRIGVNTLEAKQFFKTLTGVREFVQDSVKQTFVPPYKYIFTVDIDAECLN